MNDLQWYDYMRLLTSMFAILGMCRLGLMYRARQRNQVQDRRATEKRLDDFFWLVSAMLFTQVYGALEAVLKDADYRSAAVLSFCISIVAIRATRNSKQPITTL